MSDHVASLKDQTKNQVWVFPKERFIAYGPEDEWWAKKVEFGMEVEILAMTAPPPAPSVGLTS